MITRNKILLPTAYFPPITYFCYLGSGRKVFIESMETFPRQTYRNRCEIMTASGVLNLIVPISRPDGNHTLTKDIEISFREPWNRHHWKSISTAYRSAPYFNYYTDLIQPLFSLKEKLLINYNQKILNTIIEIIGINPVFEFTSNFIKEPEGFPDLRLKMKHGRLPEMNLPPYPQVFAHLQGFRGNLSILDLIFNLGPETGNYLSMTADC